MSNNVGILICDLFPVRGHRFLNRVTIEALKPLNPVICVARDYFDDSSFEADLKVIYHPQIRSRINLLRCIHYTFHFIRLLYKYKFSKVLILTYETRSFFLVRLFAPKFLNKIYLVQHYNIDALKINKFSKWCFSKYCNHVFHIVYHEYIKTHLVEENNLNDNKVICINHPLNNSHSSEISEEKLVLALGESNSIEKINELISYEASTHQLQNAGYSVMIKEKPGLHKMQQASLQYRTGFIPTTEYDALMKKARWVLVLYPDDFVYRESGLLLEALSNATFVIGYQSCKVLEAYSQNYPSFCVAVNSVSELVTTIVNYNCKNSALTHNYSKFLENHSVENYSYILQQLFY